MDAEMVFFGWILASAVVCMSVGLWVTVVREARKKERFGFVTLVVLAAHASALAVFMVLSAAGLFETWSPP